MWPFHSGTRQIFLRALNSLEAKPLAGTEGANTPFFSPDGQSGKPSFGAWWPRFSMFAGIVVLVGAVMLYVKPEQPRSWGVVVLVASALNFFVRMGGLYSGSAGYDRRRSGHEHQGLRVSTGLGIWLGTKGLADFDIRYLSFGSMRIQENMIFSLLARL
jgi:hypothetical protein